MKSTFTAKYLQHLNKKNGNKGFTLIELLVVIIIVGVLAAIALPSFLNQIGKARGSEAKSNLGVINRAQQSYRLENQSFAGQLSYLDAQISPKFYSYVATGGQYTTKTVTTTTAGNSDLKVYAGGVSQSALDNTIKTMLCESTATSANSGTADVSMTGSATVTAGGTCSSTTVEIK